MHANLPELQRLSIHMVRGMLVGPRPFRQRREGGSIWLGQEISARERGTENSEVAIGIGTPIYHLRDGFSSALLAKC